MKWVIALCLTSISLWACPEGTHAETKTKSDYVCNTSYEEVCGYQYGLDPTTGEYKYDYMCTWQNVQHCDWQTSTYEDCVADIVPYDPPYEPPYEPAHTPASLSTLKEGDSVVTLYSTYLQMEKQTLAVIPMGATLKVEKIHPTGWIWTTYKDQKGWVKIGTVYIKRGNGKPDPKPATFQTLRLNDQVLTMRPTNLQVGTQVLGVLPEGAILNVDKIDQSGWFYTSFAGKEGWVKIGDVYIN